MSAPFIFITTHKINPGELGEFHSGIQGCTHRSQRQRPNWK